MVAGNSMVVNCQTSWHPDVIQAMGLTSKPNRSSRPGRVTASVETRQSGEVIVVRVVRDSTSFPDPSMKEVPSAEAA